MLVQVMEKMPHIGEVAGLANEIESYDVIENNERYTFRCTCGCAVVPPS
jgi:hypothetical protein